MNFERWLLASWWFPFWIGVAAGAVFALAGILGTVAVLGGLLG